MNYKKYRHRFLRHFISMPFIYSVIVAFVIFDIWVEMYHRICFPLYGIPYVKRRNYIKIDRHKLKYLNVLQKLNCMYCGYANGLVNYASAITGETEKYWCGIHHDKREGFQTPVHHSGFLKYNDAEGFKQLTSGNRQEIR